MTVANTAVITGWYEQQVKRRLEHLWSFLRQCDNYGLDYQWTGPFLVNLIRLTLTVNVDMQSDLERIVRMELPLTSASLLLLALLEFAEPSTSQLTIRDYAEKLSEFKRNGAIKTFISFFKSKDILQIDKSVCHSMPDDGHNQRTFPHECDIDRLSAKSKRVKLNHSVVSLEQAVDNLRTEIREGACFSAHDLYRMRSLMEELRKLLSN